VRHAYYIAHLDTTFGDKEYAVGLKEIYLSYCIDFARAGSQFCGVSMYDVAGGSKTIIILRNFFNEKPDAFAIHQVG
jgi:hypothetical protein